MAIKGDKNDRFPRVKKNKITKRIKIDREILINLEIFEGSEFSNVLIKKYKKDIIAKINKIIFTIEKISSLILTFLRTSQLN